MKMRMLPALLLYMYLPTAWAAKVTVRWVNPSENTNGQPLTDLKYVKLEYDGCDGTWSKAWIVQTSVPGAAVSAVIGPQGLSRVCVRAFAYNEAGASSAASNTATKILTLPKPGQPVQLGDAVEIELTFTTTEEKTDG